MDDVSEEIQATYFAFLVATFLLKTSRVQKAIELCKECVIFLNSKAWEKEHKCVNMLYVGLYSTIGKGCSLTNDHTSAVECCRNLLVVLQRCGERAKEGMITFKLATFYQHQCKYTEAKDLYEKALMIVKESGPKNVEASCYENLATVFQHLNDYGKAEEYFQNALAIRKEIGDRLAEAGDYEKIADVCQHLGANDKAEESLQKALAIRKDFGDREGEALCYSKLAILYESFKESVKAKGHLERALAITKEIGLRPGEATVYENLGSVFNSLGEYENSKQSLQKALQINKEIGDRKGEASCYKNLGTVFQNLGEYVQAIEYFHKALAIKKEITDKKGYAKDFETLGNLFHCVGEYANAEEYLQEALAIVKENGDRKGEASCYGNLGDVFRSRCDYGKAVEYLQKALTIKREIGDREGEAKNCGILGTVFRSLGEFSKAEEFIEKALAIRREIGDRKGEAADCQKLGGLFAESLGQYNRAKEYIEKALAIHIQTDDRKGIAAGYGNLGTVFLKHREYAKAKEYLEKALSLSKETDDRDGEASNNGNLGGMFYVLDEYEQAEEYFQKELAVRKQMGDKQGEARCYMNIGAVLRSRGEYLRAREYHEKALAVTKHMGDSEAEFKCHNHLIGDMLYEGKINQALPNLLSSIEKSECMRKILGDNDQHKISFLEGHDLPYRLLSVLLCSTGNIDEALNVVELGRARALADLMCSQYSTEEQVSINPLPSVRIECVMKKECDCTCLFISYFNQIVFLWVLKANKPILYRAIDVNDCLNNKGSTTKRKVDEIFRNEAFRRFPFVAQEHCEDRSLFSSHTSGLESSSGDGTGSLRIVEEEEDEDQRPDPTLAQCYKMLIAPVTDLLDKPELIIVPDRCFYKVPFPALSDENGNILSQTFRIRIVPSLMTLKLIQDSPADYHSQTDALIVGEPKVNQVFYKGRVERLCSLPHAREEAEVIGRLLRAQPLLGQQATKQAVLQRIHSVALVHFAAHGNAERGEIALAPQVPNSGIPQEDDYLLTIADISKVRLRAKLVVLSCCHSALGQIRSEGVVGIARAFLGSGARSVLVALWALEDKATQQFMSRFYEQLVRGESASESLHQAMKWMRENGFSDVGQWAPFMLIGDNVTFAFGK